MKTEDQRAVERYLDEINTALSGMPRAGVAEFIRELQAHLAERANDGPAGGFDPRALGTPSELAAEYKLQLSLSEVARTAHPWFVLRGLREWARLRLVGTLVFVLALVGYCTGGVFLLCTACKPFWPEVIGLWSTGNRLLLGLLTTSGSIHHVYGVSVGLWPPGFVIGTAGRLEIAPVERAGYWLLPMAALAGIMIIHLTTKIVRQVASEASRTRAMRGTLV